MGRFQVPPHTALHLRTVQKGPCVSFLLATESPNISEPGSPEESLVHPGHPEREEGTARGSQYGTQIFKPELNREIVHNSVDSGNILAIFSVDSYT